MREKGIISLWLLMAGFVLTGCGAKQVDVSTTGKVVFHFQGSSNALTANSDLCFGVFVSYLPGEHSTGMCTTDTGDIFDIGEAEGFVAMGDPLVVSVLTGESRKFAIVAYDGGAYTGEDGQTGCVPLMDFDPDYSNVDPYLIGTTVANIAEGDNVVDIDVDLASTMIVDDCSGEKFDDGNFDDTGSGSGNSCSGGESFVSQWTTTGASETITLPLVSEDTYNFTVDWGDGSAVDTITVDTDPAKTHTYVTAGTYTVTINGTMASFHFNNTGDKDKLVAVLELGDVNWDNLARAFYGCTNLATFTSSCPNTSAVTSMHQMFKDAPVVNPDVSGFDTSSVTDMSYMFDGADSATPDVSGFDTGGVNNFAFMFSNTTNANPDVSAWDTTNVTDMSGMFQNASAANPNVTSWDTGFVTSMNGMFMNATSAAPVVSGWDTSNVTTFFQMFYNATSATPDTSSWDTSAATNMSGMFRNASIANPGTAGWATTSVSNMSNMFSGASAANPDVSGWDTSSVVNFASMFESAVIANPAVGSWDTSAGANMMNMFYGASSANPDVSGWDTTAVTTMAGMFRTATSAAPDVSGFVTTSVTNMSSMFMGATSANPVVSGWNTANVTNMSNMFSSASSANPDFTALDFSSVTSMTSMFTGSALDDTNYTNLLISMDSSGVTPGSTTLDAPTSMYFPSAAAARANIIGNGWTINDGGPVPLDFAYSSFIINEAGSNDGTFVASITITLTNDTLTGTNTDDFIGVGKVTATNVPSGLTAVMTRTSANTLDLMLTGTAIAHANVDDVPNLNINFLATAVNGGNVTGAVNENAVLTVDYTD